MPAIPHEKQPARASGSVADSALPAGTLPPEAPRCARTTARAVGSVRAAGPRPTPDRRGSRRQGPTSALTLPGVNPLGRVEPALFFALRANVTPQQQRAAFPADPLPSFESISVFKKQKALASCEKETTTTTRERDRQRAEAGLGCRALRVVPPSPRCPYLRASRGGQAEQRQPARRARHGA